MDYQSNFINPANHLAHFVRAGLHTENAPNARFSKSSNQKVSRNIKIISIGAMSQKLWLLEFKIFYSKQPRLKTLRLPRLLA